MVRLLMGQRRVLLRGVIETPFGGVPVIVFQRRGEFLRLGDICGVAGQGMKRKGRSNETCIVIGGAFMAGAAGAVAVQQPVVFPEQVQGFGESLGLRHRPRPCCQTPAMLRQER